MRNLWVVVAVAACGGSSKPATVAETEKPEPVEHAAAPAAAPAPKVASDPEESGQVASDPEEGGQVASAAGPGLGQIGASGGGTGEYATGQGVRRQGFGVSVKPAEPDVSGDIDREVLKKVVRRHSNEVRYCYEQALMKNPSLAGKVVVVFTIEKSGKVSAATATGIDDDLDRCIEGRFKTWVFPKLPDVVQISYPIVLTPQ